MPINDYIRTSYIHTPFLLIIALTDIVSVQKQVGKVVTVTAANGMFGNANSCN